MSNDLTQPKPLDAFGSYDDEVENGENEVQSRVIRGQLVSFTNEGLYKAKGEGPLEPSREFIAADVVRVETCWGKDKKPREVRVLGPGEKYRDLEMVNESIPRSEWVTGPDGKPRGPWQQQRFVILADRVSLDMFTFATSSIGGTIAVGELVDRTNWMRRFQGSGVYAVVRLASRWMNTKYGGRSRPHFDIIRWIALDAGNAITGTSEEPKQIEAKPATAEPDTFVESPKTEPKAEAQPLKTVAETPSLKTVEEPSLKEEMKDEIPF